VFHMDIAKLDRDVAYVVSISEPCCKHLFKMFHLFQTYVASVFDVDVAHISHTYCKSMFKIFLLFHSYAAISVFMLQVASILSRCCIYFTHMMSVYVLNVLSTSDICERY
jgi:hypothetical protein